LLLNFESRKNREIWVGCRFAFTFAGIKPAALLLVYNTAIRLYVFFIRLAARWNEKARLWLQGRKQLFERLQESLGTSGPVIWVHCSSAGELEQGKPIIEELKTHYPQHKLLVTFFSPSGYEAAENYKGADVVAYLPADTAANARRFIDLVNPELVVFVKYEFWYHHLAYAAYKHIPVLLVSAVFRKNQVFFRWYGRFFREILFFFRHVFVQDAHSLNLLQQQGITHCSIGGDTRFDRVASLSATPAAIPAVEQFVQQHPVLVAGSTWPGDEKLLASALPPQLKCIIAPHEVHNEHIRSLRQLFPNALLYSQVREAFETGPAAPVWNLVNEETGNYLKKQLAEAQVLIIDNVGMLSKLYRYATIAYVGGGFTRDGIHNTLEPATFGKPVIFGSNYKKYREAGELISCGGGFTIDGATALQTLLKALLTDKEKLHRAGEASRIYIQENTGAARRILIYIQANRLLTR